MQFDWEKFLDESCVYVHCKTEEEAKDFCKQMHEHGLEWCTGERYLNNTSYYCYKDKTCYSNLGGFGSINFYKSNDWEVLRWSDYMCKINVDHWYNDMVI